MSMCSTLLREFSSPPITVETATWGSSMSELGGEHCTGTDNHGPAKSGVYEGIQIGGLERQWKTERGLDRISMDDHVFFWKTNEEHGWGSQWYPSKFEASVVFEEGGKAETVEFATAEHWMMVQKALLFEDWGMAREIMGVKDMTRVKALGRRVAGFEEEKWVEAREGIVVAGNLHKFRQNEELRDKLLATGERIIVEASPRDRIWGIGFGAKNALRERERWGMNLLGKVLEEVRAIIRGV